MRCHEARRGGGYLQREKSVPRSDLQEDTVSNFLTGVPPITECLRSRKQTRSCICSSPEMLVMPEVSDVFDYVIVGAGAAGCVLANRLSADGRHSVCLLEAGPPDKSLLLHVPAGVYKASTSDKYAWQFETEPNPHTGVRAIPMPQGKTLGGSTSINGMNYNRGSKADFDRWAELGNREWSYSDVLPYFKKTEKRIGDCDPEYRGLAGELPITDCDWKHPLCDAFIDAAASLGVERNPDYNGKSQAGVGYYQRYISDGWRFSASRAFLHPIRRRANLHIITGAQATAVLLESKRATGVRYAHVSGAIREARANREVILAAGSANTPKLLQLSGIGEGAWLKEIGVQVAHDLRGVGASAQDHFMVHLVTKVTGTDTINGRGLALIREGAKWLLGRPSLLSISPSLVFGFVNSRDLISPPDIQLDFAIGNYCDSTLERVPVIKLGFYQLRPRSRGYVRAKSSNPFVSPEIQPNYIAHPDDRRVVVDAVRTLRRLFEAPPLGAYCIKEELPGAEVQSDASILDFARAEGLTAYHLCGTCRMGPATSADSVVDDELRVHGLEGLRIADASIMPNVPSANTSAAVFMIAEKAADMILGGSTVQQGVDVHPLAAATPA
jgi:choline dehydrogenase